jgi:hypothetical protein
MAITTDDLRNFTFGEPAEITMQRAFDAFARGTDVLQRPVHSMLTAGIEKQANRMDWAHGMRMATQLAQIAIERDPEII